MAAGGPTLDAWHPTTQKAGGRLEELWIEGTDLGNEISTGSNERESKLQQHLRSGRGPRDRPVELLAKGRPVAELLRPAGGDHDVWEAQRAGDVLEEGALAGVRLQQGELHLWHRHRQWYGREPTSAADVDHPGDPGPRYGEHGAGIRDQRLDLLERVGAGEVDAAVPLEQELRVLLNFRVHILTI